MGQPLILPKWKFFDANGLPLAAGQLFSYAAGTTTPQATYTDQSEGTPNANPLVLDANGEGVIWIGSLSYKFVLQDSLGNVLWTADGIQTIPNGSITTVKLADGSVTTIKIADGAVTTAKILDANVTNAKIADGAITGAKIPDASITFAKLVGSTQVAFVDTGGPRNGEGPTAFPVKPWSAPTVIASADTPPVGDGLSVAWSPNGKILAVAENNTDFVALYHRFGTELVKLTPGILGPPSSTGTSLAWSPNGQYLVASGGSITTAVFQRQGNTLGGLLTPASAITGAVHGLAFCPNGRYFAIAHATSPYVSVLKLSDVSPNHVAAVYTSNVGTLIGILAILNYANQETDNLSSVVTGASWTFTAKRRNTYHVKALATFDRSGGGVAGTASSELTLYRNGAAWKQLSTLEYDKTATVSVSIGGSTSVDLDAGETLQVKISDGGGSRLVTDNTKNYVSIIEASGYEALSSFALLSNPATLPTGTGKCVAWSPDGQFLAVGNEALYTFTVTAANATTSATYSDSNGHSFVVMTTIAGATSLLCSGAIAPAASGVLTKLSGTGDATIAYSSVSPSTSYLTIYQRTGDTFAKCADPVSLPAGPVNGLSWSPDGLKLTCVHATTPFITSYYRTATSGIASVTFTKIGANPNTLPASTGNACAYNSLGNKLAVAHDTSPFLTIYTVAGSGSATTYTKDTDPVTLPNGNGKSVSWTPDSQYLSVGHVSSPYVTNYKTSGSYGSAAITYVNEVDLV